MRREQLPEGRPKRASIWAQDRRGVLGDGADMLWHVPADFRHFKAETYGCPIIMGRASFEALGGALPGRLNIVLSRDPDYFPVADSQQVRAARSLDEAVQVGDEACAETGAQTVWITGGGQVYRQAMPLVDELVVTELDLDVAKTADISTLVTAPQIDPEVWEIDPSRSDATWRPQSGDAKWRVATYIRRDSRNRKTSL